MMADVSHELGALRFVVDSPLSSKVAMFNSQAQQHKQAQLMNPFSQTDGRASPKPTFSKDEYGKPLAGSLTEMRGQKANMHVLKEMVELCQIISSEGYEVKDEPHMRVIPFGELFNIYNYISDKVVGILLRARKHKLVQFEGEMLFQRRDDDVPIFLLRPIVEIRKDLESKIEEIKRAATATPLATTLLLDKGLSVPNSRSGSKSRTPSPIPSQSSVAASPIASKASSPAPAPAPAPTTAPVEIQLGSSTPSAVAGLKTESVPTGPTTTPALSTVAVETLHEVNANIKSASSENSAATTPAESMTPLSSNTETVIRENEINNINNNNNNENNINAKTDINNNENNNNNIENVNENVITNAPTTELINNTTTETATAIATTTNATVSENELPIIIIEASATHVSQNTSNSSTSSAEDNVKQQNSETSAETTAEQQHDEGEHPAM